MTGLVATRELIITTNPRRSPSSTKVSREDDKDKFNNDPHARKKAIAGKIKL